MAAETRVDAALNAMPKSTLSTMSRPSPPSAHFSAVRARSRTGLARSRLSMRLTQRWSVHPMDDNVIMVAKDEDKYVLVVDKDWLPVSIKTHEEWDELTEQMIPSRDEKRYGQQVASVIRGKEKKAKKQKLAVPVPAYPVEPKLDPVEPELDPVEPKLDPVEPELD
jgi:hypothetical protein